MCSLAASELLRVWEQGLAQRPSQRALALLAVAWPERPTENLARLSIGQRDRLLLGLRESMFGPVLNSVTACPVCQERLDLSIQISEIRVEGEPALPGSSEAAPDLTVEAQGYQVRFRLPNSLDMIIIDREATSLKEVGAARAFLFRRCLVSISHGSAPVDMVADPELPEGVMDAVLERMAQADPQAEILLSLTCPACQHHWQAPFDILAFFWKEINAWAYRTLEEVHLLALSYGWSEAECLALNPWRRRIYLEMLGEVR